MNSCPSVQESPILRFIASDGRAGPSRNRVAIQDFDMPQHREERFDLRDTGPEPVKEIEFRVALS